MFVGQLSYSWYLWHWPVYVLLAYTSLTGHLRPGEKVAGLTGSFAAAVLSFKFVEPVFRRKDNWWANNTRFASVVAAVWICLIAFSAATWLTEKGGIRIDSNISDTPPPHFFEDHLVVTDNITGATCWEDVPIKAIDYSALDRDVLLASRSWHQGWEIFDLDKLKVQRVIVPQKTDTPKVVLAGSSIAASYAVMIERLAAAYSKPVGFHVAMGISALMDLPKDVADAAATDHSANIGRHSYEGYASFVHQPEYDVLRMQDLEAWKPEVLVWADDFGLMADVPSEELRPRMRSTLEKFALHAERIVIVDGLPNPAGNFAEHSKGYKHNLNKAIVNVWRKWKQFAPLALLKELLPERRLRVNEDLRWAAQNLSQVTFVPIAPLFLQTVEWAADDAEYVRLIDPYTGRMSFLDQVHLNADGARVLEGPLRKAVFGEPACGERGSSKDEVGGGGDDGAAGEA